MIETSRLSMPFQELSPSMLTTSSPLGVLLREKLTTPTRQGLSPVTRDTISQLLFMAPLPPLQVEKLGPSIGSKKELSLPLKTRVSAVHAGLSLPLLSLRVLTQS